MAHFGEPGAVEPVGVLETDGNVQHCVSLMLAPYTVIPGRDHRDSLMLERAYQVQNLLDGVMSGPSAVVMDNHHGNGKSWCTIYEGIRLLTAASCVDGVKFFLNHKTEFIVRSNKTIGVWSGRDADAIRGLSNWMKRCCGDRRPWFKRGLTTDDEQLRMWLPGDNLEHYERWFDYRFSILAIVIDTQRNVNSRIVQSRAIDWFDFVFGLPDMTIAIKANIPPDGNKRKADEPAIKMEREMFALGRPQILDVPAGGAAEAPLPLRNHRDIVYMFARQLDEPVQILPGSFLMNPLRYENHGIPIPPQPAAKPAVVKCAPNPVPPPLPAAEPGADAERRIKVLQDIVEQRERELAGARRLLIQKERELALATRKDDGDADYTVCTICTEVLNPREGKLVMLECNHNLHEDCYNMILEGGKMECPSCRLPIVVSEM